MITVYLSWYLSFRTSIVYVTGLVKLVIKSYPVTKQSGQLHKTYRAQNYTRQGESYR